MKKRSSVLLRAAASFAMALCLGVSAQDPRRPPNDDSEESTVQVRSGWTTHKLDVSECIARSKAVLSARMFFIDDADKRVVYGLKEGLTTSIRCDYEGVAFFVVAYRKRPNPEVQPSLLEGLRADFSK